MTSKIACPLCGNETIKKKDREDIYLINCSSCGDFQITRECLDDLPAERKLHLQLMKVSAFTRHRTINKEPIVTLFIGDPNGYSEGYTIQQIIDEFPSIPERKLKALQNIQGLSKYWGDEVMIERKDYSIFLPEVNEEQPSLMMMRTLVKEDLVSGEVKFPTQLTVTEKGISLLKDQEVLPPMPVVSPATELPASIHQTSKLEGLHPRVLEVAQGLFQNGHFRSAVLDTYVALDNDVQSKSRLSITGTPLMRQAFSKNDPILKLNDAPDAQMGAMDLFSGAAMGVRNVLAHDQKSNPSEQEALELLYFASMLFRKLDKSVNNKVEKLLNEIAHLSFSSNDKSSFQHSTQIRKFLIDSEEFNDSQLYRLCFYKILRMIKSNNFDYQNAGIDLILEWHEKIIEYITDEDHIDLVTLIYKASGYSYPSYSAKELIEKNLKPLVKSLKLFQERLISNAEVFNELLEEIWWKDKFFESIAQYSDVDFMKEFLNKILDEDIVLNKNDFNALSHALNCAGRGELANLTGRIYKMNKELNE